jgi:hypothetical protein
MTRISPRCFYARGERWSFHTTKTYRGMALLLGTNIVRALFTLHPSEFTLLAYCINRILP